MIPLRDMVQLANINTAMDVGYLMLEYKINLKIPEFYDKKSLTASAEFTNPIRSERHAAANTEG